MVHQLIAGSGRGADFFKASASSTRFEEPFVVDSGKFQRAFGDQATPVSEAIPATVEWFRTHPKS